MTYYIRQGNTFRQTPTSAIDIKTKLPVGTYAIKLDEMGYFFDQINNFELPPKLYGDCTKNTNRIINTFHDRPNTTGVFLEGEKGSGKTLLAKSISIELLKQDIPTLVVNSQLCGESFNTFVQQIDQPAVMLFDEFEKVYDQEHQPRILTLFDGVYPTKKLFIVTCNDSWRIDSHLKNRPGRLFYMLTFGGLDKAFIEEYANENLKDKSQVQNILLVAGMFSKFNFDMLKALVEEMNRYNETAQEALKMLNTKPKDESTFSVVSIVSDGEVVDIQHLHNKTWDGNPMEADDIQLYYMDRGNPKSAKYYMFTSEDLVKVDAMEGKFIFTNEENETLTLVRQKDSYHTDWTKFVL